MRINLRLIIFCWGLFLFPALLFAQKGIWSDGPYIFKKENGFRVVGSLRNQAGDTTSRLVDTLYTRLADLGDVALCSEDGVYEFKVPAAFLSETQPIAAKPPVIKAGKGEKMFVISDSHGNFENFVSILRAGGVLNENLAWNYGANRLLILGDTFDRGDDVLAIFWLIYSLEKQAEQAGGALTYLWGNHDGMVLKGDLRYVTEKYKKMQDTLKMPYQTFFSKDSYLGGWLRGKEAVKIVGKNLFVHGGISPEFAGSGISLAAANEQIEKHLDTPKKQYDSQTEFLFGSNGPLWYRGLVSDQEKYNPIAVKQLRKILKQYKVSRIFVGHTTFEGVQDHHAGKVISVDSKNKKKHIDHLYQGVEIMGNTIKIVTIHTRE